MSPEESLESRLDARMIRAIRDLDLDSFRSFMVHLANEMGLKVTAAVAMDDVVYIEAEREGTKYLMVASRKPEHASDAGLKLVRERAMLEGRQPVLLVTGRMDEQVIKRADELEISLADREKFLLLLRTYGLSATLLREIDRKILEKEGNRFLPSIGRFDALLQSAEDAVKHERYRDAIDDLDRALSIKPEHDLAWRMKAQAFLGLKQNERALEAITQAINVRDTDPWSWYTLGVIFNGLGRYSDEVAAYDQALRLYPRLYPATLNKASTLFALGRKQDALKVLDDMIRYYPNDLRVLVNRGVVLRSLGRTKEALEAFESVSALDPSNVEALSYRAATLDDIGSVNEAVDAWKEAVQAARKRADLWLKLGEAQKAAGMLDDAARSFSVAATLDPTLGEAVKRRDEALASTGAVPEPAPTGGEEALLRKYLDAAILLQAAGEFEGALREAERCMSFEPRAPEAFVRKASILMDLGRIEEAIATLTAAVMEGARTEEVLLDLEALTNKLGRKEEAIRVLAGAPMSTEVRVRRCLSYLDVGRAEAGLNALPEKGDDEPYPIAMARGMAQLAMKRYAEAAETLASLRERFPGSPHLANALGTARRFSGDMEGAEEALHEAVESEPLYADAWNNLGCVNYLQGSYEQAERSLNEAVLLDRRPQFLLDLGMCQLGRGDLDAAESSFESAMQLEPSAEALNGLGVVAERRKENARALELYEAALKRVPEFRDAQYNRARVKSVLKE
ncbi:MAG TPA: tetratricopeptide repeat protein [Methanomassiliicoccales archaeon]|nr:tetratricopeptide repeat protein [Methanomassiliicoccales archaeon]